MGSKTDRKKSVIGLVAGLVSKVRSLLFARELLDAGWVSQLGIIRSLNRSWTTCRRMRSRMIAGSVHWDCTVCPV